MRRTLAISYWIAATLLVAAVVVSLGYRAGEAFFIGTLFLPGALAAKYAYSHVNADSRPARIRNIIYITAGILLGEILLFFIAHLVIYLMSEALSGVSRMPALPSVLVNPVFIAIIIAMLSTGSVMLDSYLKKKYPDKSRSITFLSDRRSVTLETGSILYVESNDSVTTVYAEDGQTYRNKTSISGWESILSDEFIRIHRSYLVRRTAITGTDKDCVYIGGTELPVSRKYKDSVKNLNDN